MCCGAGGQADGNGDCMPGWFAGSASTALDCLFIDFMRCRYVQQLLQSSKQFEYLLVKAIDTGLPSQPGK